MNILSTGNTIEDNCMQTFYSLQAFMLETKTLTYLLMGGGIIALALFWRFLSARDDEIRKY